MKGEFINMTDHYLELYHKAHLLAAALDYELIAYNGKFTFYNNPSLHSFTFQVDPLTFHKDVNLFLCHKLEGRCFE